MWKTKGHEGTKNAVKAFLLASKYMPWVREDWDAKNNTLSKLKKQFWLGVEAEAKAAIAAGRKTG